MTLPLLHHVRQTAAQPAIADVPGEVRQQWLASAVAKRVKTGDRIAIGCGSRGIRHIDVIAKATVDAFREMGAKPFVVAAMGSHGGATPEGQRELLAGYGLRNEDSLGVPVKHGDGHQWQIGVNSWGEPVWWDRNALAADGVVTVVPHQAAHRLPRPVRVRHHAKMCVIGLGKRDGANQHHRWGWKGLQQMLPESMKVVLEKTKFLGGLGILENANEETAHLEVVDRRKTCSMEPNRLLERAKGADGQDSRSPRSTCCSSARSARTTPGPAWTRTSSAAC